MTRSDLIKQVHVLAGKGNLNLPREIYEDVVEGATGARSVKDLPDEEIQKVLTALRRFSFATGRPPTRNMRAGQHQNFPQQKKIARLMDYLGWSWASTARLCEKITGKKDTRDCDSAELRKIILAMTSMIEQNIQSGKLKLTPRQLGEFRKWNFVHHATPSIPPPLHEGEPEGVGNDAGGVEWE